MKGVLGHFNTILLEDIYLGTVGDTFRVPAQT